MLAMRSPCGCDVGIWVRVTWVASHCDVVDVRGRLTEVDASDGQIGPAFHWTSSWIDLHICAKKYQENAVIMFTPPFTKRWYLGVFKSPPPFYLFSAFFFFACQLVPS